MDGTAIAQVWAQTDRELWLLTARDGERHGGLIATFVSQASIAPHLPRVVVGLAKQHYTRQLVEASRRFVLHLLSEQQVELVWRFGLRSGRDYDKLDGLDWAPSMTGSVRLADALAWLDCRVETSLDVGDRTIYVAEIVAGRQEKSVPPLTLKRLLQIAPPERMSELKEGMLRDAAIDAAAIEKWRLTCRE
jgi:flavin reductase (DIM6/NTAB) family NADH-FMN oxidoreductase RutF